MKNSAIYSMALASVLVLSLVDVEARGLGAGVGVQQQQAPHVQQQQAPHVQQQQTPHVQQQQAPRSSGRPGGGIAYSAPSMSRPSQVHVQSTQSLRQVSRPSQVRVQSPQGSQQVSRQSQVHAQSVQKPVTMQSKPQVSQTSDIWNPVRDTPIRCDATRPSAALPQSSQVFGGYKAGPWNNRSSHARRRSRTGAGAFSPSRRRQNRPGQARNWRATDNGPGSAWRECSGGPTNS